jgi:hypothetical protein
MIENGASKRNDNVDCNTRFIDDATHENPMVFAMKIMERRMLFLFPFIAFRQ